MGWADGILGNRIGLGRVESSGLGRMCLRIGLVSLVEDDMVRFGGSFPMRTAANQPSADCTKSPNTISLVIALLEGIVNLPSCIHPRKIQ
jgi:hypothetical protein